MSTDLTPPSESAAKLLPELLALPRPDQEYLFQQLSGALDEESGEDAELVAELDRRLARYQSGESPGVPAEEVFRRLRERRP
jgi:putative addiction module component (TIGR02574 family)